MQVAPRPSPFRTPLLLGVSIGFAWGAFHFIGGTGGLDPAWLTGEDRTATYTFFWFLRDLFGPFYVLLAIALGLAGLTRGRSAVEAAALFAFGSNEKALCGAACDFWAFAARTLSWLGLLTGLAAVALIDIAYRNFAVANQHLFWDLVDLGRRWYLAGPVTGLLVGRLLFAGLAAQARIRTGAPTPRTFSAAHDLAQLCTFAIYWYYLRVLTWSPPCD